MQNDIISLRKWTDICCHGDSSTMLYFHSLADRDLVYRWAHLGVNDQMGALWSNKRSGNTSAAAAGSSAATTMRKLQLLMTMMTAKSFPCSSAGSGPDWRPSPSRPQGSHWWSHQGSSDTLRRKRITAMSSWGHMVYIIKCSDIMEMKTHYRGCHVTCSVDGGVKRGWHLPRSIRVLHVRSIRCKI